MQNLTGGREQVSVEGATVREIIESLEVVHSGIRERLCKGDRLKPTIAVFVDSEVSPLGLRQKVSSESEINFLPAMSGG